MYGNFHAAVRFARLTGLPEAATAAWRCRLALPQRPATGTVAVRVLLDGARVARGTPLRLKLMAKGPETVVQTRSFSSGDQQALAVEVPIDTPGDYYWRAEIRPEKDDDDRPPMTLSESRYAPVTRAGSLETRTDLNYYTHEREARIRGTLIGATVPTGSRALLTVRAAGASQGGTASDAPPAGMPPAPIFESSSSVERSPFVVTLPLTELPLGEFEGSLHLVDPENRKISTGIVPLVRRLAKHNEVKIRWDNFLAVAGEPFFPLYLFTHDVLEAHALGANAVLTVGGNYPERLVQLARRFDIRFIIRGPSTRWADEPQMLAFVLEDEPEPLDGGPNPRAVAEAADARRVSPYHPTYINLTNDWQAALAYAGASDTIGQDPYASAGSYKPRHVSESTRQMILATRGRQPIWQTLQPFHFRFDRIHPTPSEFRHSIYSAIVHGAHSIGLWGVELRNGFRDEDIRGMLSDRPLFQEAAKVLHSVRRLSPVIMSEEVVEQPAVVDNEEVAILTKRHDGQLYVWLLNMTHRLQKVTVLLPGAMDHVTLINEVRPGGTVEVDGGSASVRLEPLQPMVLWAKE